MALNHYSQELKYLDKAANVLIFKKCTSELYLFIYLFYQSVALKIRLVSDKVQHIQKLSHNWTVD